MFLEIYVFSLSRVHCDWILGRKSTEFLFSLGKCWMPQDFGLGLKSRKKTLNVWLLVLKEKRIVEKKKCNFVKLWFNRKEIKGKCDLHYLLEVGRWAFWQMSLMAAIFPPLNLSFHALGGIIDVEANPFFKIIGGLSSGSKSALASCGQLLYCLHCI